jgi:hypothetical protein
VSARNAILSLIALLSLGGCSISRHIVDVQPPDQPPLQNLEGNLDYVDPDQGRPDYIFYE